KRPDPHGSWPPMECCSLLTFGQFEVHSHSSPPLEALAITCFWPIAPLLDGIDRGLRQQRITRDDRDRSNRTIPQHLNIHHDRSLTWPRLGFRRIFGLDLTN